MKIFRKVHFWKDNRTFVEVEADKPEKERGFAKEGHLLLKIGDQSQTKSAFKLSVDEARALRDSIDMFLRFHDMKLSELMTEQQEQFEKVPDYYQRSPEPLREERQPSTQAQNFFMFDDAEEKSSNEKSSKKPNSEFYF